MAGEAISALLRQFADYARGTTFEAAGEGQRLWATPHQLRLELDTMELRDFSTSQDGIPVLICAPFAVHGATIADFARSHSVVEALHAAGADRVHVTDWRSAKPEMRLLSIDNYLADLNVAVDQLQPPVDLIGLCQGGWLALLYAARFPDKVRRLVLAGAPVDIRAGESSVSQLAASNPLTTFEAFISVHGGRVLNQHILHMWGPALSVKDERQVLQVSPNDHSSVVNDLLVHFQNWFDLTVDLPGTYYIQIVSWLFKENRLAEGNFVALGRRIDLSSVHHPIFLLGARDDDLVAPGQLFATAKLVGTPQHHIEMVTEPCEHLSLFLGAETLKRSWTRIAHWLDGEMPSTGTSRPGEKEGQPRCIP